MKHILLFYFICLSTSLALAGNSDRKSKNTVETIQKETETSLRGIIEPLLEKHCRDECKFLSVKTTVDISTPDEVAPGFDADSRSVSALAPTNATIKLLMDQKFGPNSRNALLTLLNKYLEAQDFPVKIETQITRFPEPSDSAAKVTDIRNKISQQFRAQIDEIFQKYCPDQCLLSDYELDTDVTNPEEAQYGSIGEFYEHGGVAVKLKELSGTILVDESLGAEEQATILQMAKLKTNSIKNVFLSSKTMKFPHTNRLDESGLGYNGTSGTGRNGRDLASSSKNESKSQSREDKNFNSKDRLESNNTNQSSKVDNNTQNNSEKNNRDEKYERFEKIERVEQGDAVQQQLKRYSFYAMFFGFSVISILIFIVLTTLRPKNPSNSISKYFKKDQDESGINPLSREQASEITSQERRQLVAKRFEIERIKEDLLKIFSDHPKVAKQVFSRVLTEEGVETTAQYIHIFGETIIIDMLKDPSLQSDIADLMEYFAKNPIELTEDEELDLLKKAQNRTVAGKLVVLGSRSSHLFDFLVDMDGLQIMELIRNESLTVKSIILTQCDSSKRTAIFSQMDEAQRMQLLSELSRIDYLPRDYIFNVANALKRKRKDNPKLNTEALPGSEVLVTLLEKSTPSTQRSVLKSLEISNPESARHVKAKLVSTDTLRFLADGQLLEIVLSLKHDEILTFLKGTTEELRVAIFSKSPRDLASDLEEELVTAAEPSKESYQIIERKILNRMKVMSSEGLINLVETNERMLSQILMPLQSSVVGANGMNAGDQKPNIRKVAGW